MVPVFNVARESMLQENRLSRPPRIGKVIHDIVSDLTAGVANESVARGVHVGCHSQSEELSRESGCKRISERIEPMVPHGRLYFGEQANLLVFLNSPYAFLRFVRELLVWKLTVSLESGGIFSHFCNWQHVSTPHSPSPHSKKQTQTR